MNCKKCVHYRKHPKVCFECWYKGKNHFKARLLARIWGAGK